MSDHYDEMKVAPDPSQAEALRRRLHARLAATSRDDGEGQTRRHSGARPDSQPAIGSLKEIHVTEDSTTHEGRNRRVLGLAAAAVIAVIGVAGTAVAMNLGDDEAQSSAAAPITDELPEQAPLDVSACVNDGPDIHPATKERTEVSLPDGDMVIVQARGNTTRLSVSDVSDPRLDGVWYLSVDEDEYTLPAGGPGLSLSTWTTRIENDEGAWQGSWATNDLFERELTAFGVPADLRWLELVLVGEGAYEGLTAIMIRLDDDCPNTRGYIVEGGFPAPPVPQTGQ